MDTDDRCNQSATLCVMPSSMPSDAAPCFLRALAARQCFGLRTSTQIRGLRAIRIFACAGRIVRGGRHLRLRLATSWPWAREITAAIARIQALAPG
jgi:hypothetical protein